MKDSNLHRLLKTLAQSGPEPPKDLTRRTLARLGEEATLLPPTKKAPLGIGTPAVIAASLLLICGSLLATLGGLTWFDNRIALRSNLDISQDPRMISASAQLPFTPALPTWMPKGYSLLKADAEDAATLILVFANNAGEEVVITQAREAYQFIPSGVALATIGKRTGYIFISEEQGVPSLYIHHVSLHTVIQGAPDLTDRQLAMIAWGMVGGEGITLTPYREYGSAPPGIQVIAPPFVPANLSYQGLYLVDLSNSFMRGYRDPLRETILIYGDAAQSQELRIRQSLSGYGPPYSGQEVPLPGATALFSEGEQWSTLTFTHGHIHFRLQLSGSQVSPDNLSAVAQSLTADYSGTIRELDGNRILLSMAEPYDPQKTVILIFNPSTEITDVAGNPLDPAKLQMGLAAYAWREPGNIIVDTLPPMTSVNKVVLIIP